jgi:hypothetical protein
MKVIRAIVGVLTALVLTPVGFGMLWFGDGELSQNRVAGILLLLVGVVLLLMVIQTGHVSSFGLAVAAVGVTAFGLAGLLLPQFAQSMQSFLSGISPQMSKPAGQWFTFGLVLAIGLVFAGIAIAAWFSHRPTDVSTSPALRGFISAVLSLIGAVAGLGFLTRVDTSFILLGALLLGVVGVIGMVSSVGLYVSGVVVFLFGLVALLFVGVARSVATSDLVGGNGMQAGAQAALQLGFVVTLGAMLLASAVVVRSVRGRAARRAVVV